MSGTEIEIVGQEQRDEAIADAIVSGRSLRAVRKEFGLSQAEIAGALERIWPVDTASRLQMIKADLGQITRLTQVFFEKGLAGDTQSCLCAVRLWERKHELLGMNAAAKFEVVTRPPEAKSSHQRIADAINQMGATACGGASCTRKAGTNECRACVRIARSPRAKEWWQRCRCAVVAGRCLNKIIDRIGISCPQSIPRTRESSAIRAIDLHHREPAGRALPW